eukprot:6199375-Pleurochrysis_carterae.AAC.7
MRYYYSAQLVYACAYIQAPSQKRQHAASLRKGCSPSSTRALSSKARVCTIRGATLVRHKRPPDARRAVARKLLMHPCTL